MRSNDRKALKVIDICRYDESFSDEVKKRFRSLWEEIVGHGDVMAGTISVALEKGHPVGVCFLMATSTYQSADLQHPGYLNMEYQAVSGEDEIEICALLIDTLIEDYRQICEEEPDKRIILRTFASPSSTEYMSFLASFGFRAQYFMYRMRKDLTEVVPEDGDGSFSFEIKNKKGVSERIDVKAVRIGSDGSADGLEGYFEANGSVFGVPDSENELIYRLREQNGIQFIAGVKGRVVAAVSIWENGPLSVSTENIFCIEEYRRLGVTEELLRGVCAFLAGKGYKEATLFVYGVNTYAVGLYTKLGYNIFGGTMHMLFEDGYVPELI